MRCFCVGILGVLVKVCSVNVKCLGCYVLVSCA